MSETQSLPTVVEVLASKAQEHKQVQNTHYHLSVAQHNIRELNAQLESLAESLRELKYFKTVLQDAFGGSPPSITGNAMELAEDSIEVSQEELLENVQSGDVRIEDVDIDDTDFEGGSERLEVDLTDAVESQLNEIQTAERKIEAATENIKTTIKHGGENWRGTDDWKDKISAAEELQSILGTDNSEFKKALNDLRRLLKQDLMDTGEGARKFVRQWDRAVSEWEKHQSLQSFDSFKEEHGLSDSTIDEIRKLSESKRLTLADVSLDTLQEMKSVADLEKSVNLSL